MGSRVQLLDNNIAQEFSFYKRMQLFAKCNEATPSYFVIKYIERKICIKYTNIDTKWKISISKS